MSGITRYESQSIYNKKTLPIRIKLFDNFHFTTTFLFCFTFLLFILFYF